MEHPDGVVAEDGPTLIVLLQHLVLAWMDGDRVLPADGARLLERLAGASAPPRSQRPRGPAPRSALSPTQWVDVQARIEAFIDQMQALIDAGLLTTADGRLALETARALREGERR